MPTQRRPLQAHGRVRIGRSPFSLLRRRPLAWWSVTLVLAAATAQLVAGAVSRAEQGAARYGTVRTALVATADVAAGTVLSASDAEERELPAALVPDGAVGVEGFGHRVAHDLFRGEVVHRDRLAPAGLSATAASLPPGTRGVAVPSGGEDLQVELGDVVDVFATVVTGASGDALGGPPTVVVASGALVVGVGESAVTVAVPLEETPQVAYAAASGIITLALVGR